MERYSVYIAHVPVMRLGGLAPNYRCQNDVTIIVVYIARWYFPSASLVHCEWSSMCNITAFQCLNLTQQRCTEVPLTVGITDLVLSIVSTSLLLCLLLVLRKKAWNSPVRRLTLILTTCICLLEFVDASVELYNNVIPGIWNAVLMLLTLVLLLTQI